MSFFDDASWLLIPEGIKEDVVYAQKPTSGLGDLVFTRASDATRTNSAGVIERTPWNLVTFSEEFTNVAWSKGATSISANTTTAPNGTLTADSLIEDSTNALHQLLQTTSSVAGIYTASVYVKPNGRNWFSLNIAGAANYAAWFDVQNGVVGSLQSNITSATITGVGNGWFRCSVTANTGSLAPRVAINLATANNIFGYLGNGTSGIFIWGAQLVEGTDAKPYFATTNRQDVPRLHYRNADGTLSTCPRLLLEPQRTNSIRNSTMVGAVAGSPGTLPTNWVSANGGLTQTIVGIGTENGLQYIDLRFNGTANATIVQLRYDAANQIAASNGQAWSYTFYLKAISQPAPPISYTQLMFERTSAGALIKSAFQVIVPTSNLQRFTYSRTLDGGATVAFVDPVLYLNITSGTTYDFTIRIAAPQMELGAYATTFIPTTTAAVTRLVDNFTRNNLFTNNIVTASGGTWFVDLSSNLSYTRDASAVGVFLSSSSTGAGVGSYTFGISTINTTARLAIAKRENGVFSALYTTLVDSIKIAIKWNGTTADVFVNGVKVVTATSFTSAALEFLNTSNLDVPKFINQMALFPVPMTDAQCIQMTT